MTTGMRNYLTGLGDTERLELARDSRESLRFAWPHRHGLRGRTVVEANVTMLRNLRFLA